jgi:hypothetical protein
VAVCALVSWGTPAKVSPTLFTQRRTDVIHIIMSIIEAIFAYRALRPAVVHSIAKWHKQTVGIHR